MHKGYTLVELLIVITLAVLLMIAAISIFFTTLIGGGKTASSEYAKQVGEQTMSQIAYIIRNAQALTLNQAGQYCQNGMSSIAVVSQDRVVASFLSQTDPQGVVRIASGSGNYITPPDIVISSPITFDCIPTSYQTSTWDGSAPTITVRFAVRKGTPGVDKPRDIVIIPFSSTVTLRNN